MYYLLHYKQTVLHDALMMSRARESVVIVLVAIVQCIANGVFTGHDAQDSLCSSGVFYPRRLAQVHEDMLAYVCVYGDPLWITKLTIDSQ